MSDDALSDYQIARRQGYRFSERRWIESLKGERGDRGERGERGERGPRGLQGEPGLNGREGKDGRNGIDGKAGVNGVDGSLPDPMPWRAKFEKGPDRLTYRISIKGSDGTSWNGNVQRDPMTNAVDYVEFVPVNV